LRRAGADIVVALCHSGISHAPPVPGEENAATALAKVGGIDAIFCGHQHLLLPGEDFRGAPGVEADRGALAGVAACMPGFWGGHIGVIDLVLRQSDERWRVESFEVCTRAIYHRDGEAIKPLVEEDVDLVDLTQGAHEATLAYVRKPAGELQAPVHSYFALISDDASVEIVNAAQRWYVERLVPHVAALQGLPILSASAPFKCGGRGGPDYYTSVEAGPIAMKNVADLYVYPNGLRVVKVTGAEAREWLERSASIFRRIDAKIGRPQPLLDKNAVSYDFDVFDGVTYEIDATAPARYDDGGHVVAPDAHRIVNLKFRGAPIDEKAKFLVVTNSYRASGGGSFPACDGSTIVFEAPDSNRDALVHYVAETGHVDPRREANWKFVPWPANLIVTYPTAPAAANVFPPPGLRLTPWGDGDGGFLEMRVEFVG
jgi:2',3'-cyclic-nucleotide 2'-phosphodiesterase/3'-nucleotidase